MSEPLLVVENLELSYPIPDIAGRVRRHFRALAGVSIRLAAGEAMGVVGESGSGKSTLARAIVGLALPTSGMIRIDGKPVPRRRGAAARLGIQMIFQDHTSTLNPFQTIGRALDEVIHLWNPEMGADQRHTTAVSLLAKVGLGIEALARHPHSFSGGQRQRIAIARALAASPRLLICDEPTSALDVSIQAQIMTLFAQLKAEGYALLFISHNLAVVSQIADQVIVMHRGAVVERGTTAEVIHAPKNPYTQRLVASAPKLTDRGSLLKAAVAARAMAPTPEGVVA
jgi:ABC-type glutathione transport system ATPase component